MRSGGRSISGGLASKAGLSKRRFKTFAWEESSEGMAGAKLRIESNVKLDLARCGVAAFGK